MKALLVRMDDITPDMNWDHFNRIQRIFETYQIKPILGVVPDNQDQTLSVDEIHEEFWDRIRNLQQKGWTIAQHGYQHVYVTQKRGLLGINPFSEFAGVPYEKQVQKLEKGLEILHKHGIYVKMFMAPGHSYDRNTLKALKSLGFSMVTDGYADQPYKRKGLIFLPCTLSTPRIPRKVDTLCLHINHMAENEIQGIDDFCKENSKMFISVEDIISEERFISYIPQAAFQERKKLLIRKCKSFAAENQIVQVYMQKTNDSDSHKKRRKRILGLPGLLIHLLFHRKYR